MIAKVIKILLTLGGIIAIILIVSKSLGPKFEISAKGVGKMVAKKDLILLKLKLDCYNYDNGGYPSTDQGLQALTEKPFNLPESSNWQGPYLEADELLDPWGKSYQYICPGEHNNRSYDLESYGPNGQPDEDESENNDDITNWKVTR